MEFNVYTMKHFTKQRKHLMESNYQSFGAAIKRKRLERNMTLEESAENICSISYLSKIENSLIEPSPKYFYLLKERFDLNDELTILPALYSLFLNRLGTNGTDFTPDVCLDPSIIPQRAAGFSGAATKVS